MVSKRIGRQVILAPETFATSLSATLCGRCGSSNNYKLEARKGDVNNDRAKNCRAENRKGSFK